MIRRPPRSTLSPSSAASDVYKRQVVPTPWLFRHHSIFGKVVEQYEVVEKISKVKTDAMDKPVSDVLLETVQIITK